MSLENSRWRMFTDQDVVEAIPIWRRPVPRFEDFFSNEELGRLGLEEAVPQLAWSDALELADGPVDRGAEALAWVNRHDRSRITLNPYKLQKLSVDSWRRVLLHELSHVANPSDHQKDPSGHGFTFGVVLASCQVRVGLPLRLRPYDVSDLPAADRIVMVRRAEQLGQRFGSSSVDLFEVPRLTDQIELAAEKRGWDYAMRPPKRFWLF
ncbi:SprT-like domain-containing protein [Xanthomonas translucens pv. translucens]|uniref:SprT-like domain-containing protein n=2 Tax=Xanthomonas campestris pv. translucens TaxID=343 RepID=UPI00056F3077|nr:SprT-like domain-containing protein [Xanthomonas translucens]MCC8445677.1 SprT-like domain-containing protein [Xanthomonas translucens pv. translucens]MCT8286286.1 SprT-like domain-containing protein [Xanthomonas translucens pv. translucens]MCT8303944.1 SprT-like domain-containing protein [Xanthomonas translucens pv. translucens]UNT99575.1 SprT-like domain-containing protein [Xanthomonas translucens pv. translucens]